MELINISQAECVCFWEFHSRHHAPRIRNRMNRSLDVQVGTRLQWTSKLLFIFQVTAAISTPAPRADPQRTLQAISARLFSPNQRLIDSFHTGTNKQVRCKSSRGDSLDRLTTVCEDREDLSAVWDVNAERQPSSSSRWRPPRWIISTGLSYGSMMGADYLQFYRIWHTPAHRWA